MLISSWNCIRNRRPSTGYDLKYFNYSSVPPAYAIIAGVLWTFAVAQRDKLLPELSHKWLTMAPRQKISPNLAVFKYFRLFKIYFWKFRKNVSYHSSNMDIAVVTGLNQPLVKFNKFSNDYNFQVLNPGSVNFLKHSSRCSAQLPDLHQVKHMTTVPSQQGQQILQKLPLLLTLWVLGSWSLSLVAAVSGANEVLLLHVFHLPSRIIGCVLFQVHQRWYDVSDDFFLLSFEV